MTQTGIPQSDTPTPAQADEEVLRRNSIDGSLADNQPFDIPVATRLSRLPPYMFGQINELLYEKRRAGHDVIDLGMGNPSDAPETEAMVCLGSKEGFSHICLALMGPGDAAIVPAPYFPVHMYAVALAAGNVIALEVSEADKFLANIAYTCEHLYPKPKLVIVNFPHNPSTVTVEPDFYRDLVKLAKQHNFMVISDFAYADLGFDGYQPASFLSAPGAVDVGVEFTTMSKGYNMAGWRVGYCCGNREMIRALGVIKGYYDYGMFQAIQVAAIMALRHTDAAVERQSAIYKQRCDVLVEGLGRIGWQVDPPRAGMFLWAAVPEPWSERMSTMDFAMKLLEEADVAVSPGSGFGPAGEGFLRMALVENENRLRQAVRQIGRCLAEQ